MAVAQRIGIYGGTFDPIHIGHLAIADEARWALDLDQVIFVPAARQPFKLDQPGADAAQRLLMARLACAANPAFTVSDSELQRAAPSYTIDTLTAFRAVSAPTATIFFILGADAARELPRWHRAAELVTLAHFAIIGRPGVALDHRQLAHELPGLAERLTLIPGPQLAISSTDVRQRLAEGRPARYQLPDAVYDYILAHGLYGSATAAQRRAPAPPL